MTNLEWLMQDKEGVRESIAGNPCNLYEFDCKTRTMKCSDCIKQWLDAEHVEPDTQEKIDADAEKYVCDYWKVSHFNCRTCYRSSKQTEIPCAINKTLDLLRRQREFDARK